MIVEPCGSECFIFCIFAFCIGEYADAECGLTAEELIDQAASGFSLPMIVGGEVSGLLAQPVHMKFLADFEVGFGGFYEVRFLFYRYTDNIAG